MGEYGTNESTLAYRRKRHPFLVGWLGWLVAHTKNVLSKVATQKEKLSKVESLVRERRFVLLSELADNLDLSYYYVRALVKTAIQVNPQLALVDGLWLRDLREVPNFVCRKEDASMLRAEREESLKNYDRPHSGLGEVSAALLAKLSVESESPNPT